MQKSEQQYKALTNSLPQIIFSLDGTGKVLYANDWLEAYTGKSLEALTASRWSDVIHPSDYGKFSLLISENLSHQSFPIKMQCRIRNAESGEFLWHLISITPIKNERGELTTGSGTW